MDDQCSNLVRVLFHISQYIIGLMYGQLELGIELLSSHSLLNNDDIVSPLSPLTPNKCMFDR
jgi:hypothetical protein